MQPPAPESESAPPKTRPGENRDQPVTSTSSASASQKNFERLIWAGLILVMLAVTAFFLVSRKKPAPLPVLGVVQPFSLTNQMNEPVSLDSLRGQVWVADIIFTRCPAQCLRMTKQMSDLKALLPPDLPVKLVSLTADPAFDSPEILRAYAARAGSKDTRWLFLTGEKKNINRLAVESLKLTVLDKKPEDRLIPDDLFIHSTSLVLIDKAGNMRAIFDGETPEVHHAIYVGIQNLLQE